MDGGSTFLWLIGNKIGYWQN